MRPQQPPRAHASTIGRTACHPRRQLRPALDSRRRPAPSGPTRPEACRRSRPRTSPLRRSSSPQACSKSIRRPLGCASPERPCTGHQGRSARGPESRRLSRYSTTARIYAAFHCVQSSLPGRPSTITAARTYGSGREIPTAPQRIWSNWDPERDTRLTAWEMVHHLARTLELRSRQRPAEALAYHGLVQSYPETSGSSRHHLRIRTWITASNHRRITAPHTRTFNHGAALAASAKPRARSRPPCSTAQHSHSQFGKMLNRSGCPEKGYQLLLKSNHDHSNHCTSGFDSAIA